VAWLTKQVFGSKSEKMDPNQGTLELEGELGKPEAPSDVQEDVLEEPKSNVKRTRRTKAELYNFDKLPKVVVGEVIPEEVQANPEAYERISEDYHDELDAMPGRVRIARTVIPKFRKKEDKQKAPVQAPAPECAIPGTMITPALAVQLLLDKHCDHLTHYRIAQRLQREFGLEIRDKTLNKWVHLTAELLKPIAHAIRDELHSCHTLQIDETPIKYLDTSKRQAQSGYLWVMRNPDGGACYYNWAQERSNEALQATLGYDQETNTLAFKGTIQCDGYKVYDSIQKSFKGLKLGGCLAHIRRYFIKDESLKVIPWVATLLRDIQDLYTIERELKDAPPDKILKSRISRSKPITDKILLVLQEQQTQYRPSSNIGEAICYALGQWPSFIEYLQNPTLAIDNNGVERAIRPTKIGAKNFLFMGSPTAGTNNAVLYTLIENCKAMGLNPRVYLEHAIKSIRSTEPKQLTPSACRHLLDESQELVA